MSAFVESGAGRRARRRPWWPVLGIRLRTTLVGTLAVLGLFVLIGFVQTQLLRADLKQQIATQQLTLLEQTTRDIDHHLALSQLALMRVAANVTPETVRDSERVAALLANREALGALFDTVLVIDASGKAIASATDASLVGLDMSQRAYFKDTIATGLPQISAPFMGQQLNQPVVAFTAPIFDRERRVVAVLFGALHLLKPNFLGELADTIIGNGGRFSLLTLDRTIVIAHDRARMMTAGPAPGTSAYFDMAMQQPQGWLEAVGSDTGLHALFAFKRFTKVPWVLVAATPVTAAFAPIAGLEQRLFWSLLLLGLLVPVVLYAGLGRPLKPLLALRNGIQALRGGNPDQTELEVADEHAIADEIGEVTHEFNKLLRESRLAQAENTSNAALLRTVTDHMPARIGYADAQERYQFANRSLVEWHGGDAQQVVGRSMRDVFGAAQYAHSAPYIRRAYAGEAVTFQRTISVPIGGVMQTRIVEAHYLPDFGRDGKVCGIVGMSTDVTEHVEAATQASAAAALLRQTVENMPVGVSVLNDKLEVVAFNHRFLEFMDLPAQAIAPGDAFEKALRIHLERGDYGHDNPEQELRRRLDMAALRQAVRFEHTRRDGRIIEIASTPAPDGGIVRVYTDITAAKEASRRLVEARETAEAAARAKSEFVATMSHEVRTPMNGVLGIAQLMLDTPLNPEQRDYVETILRSGEALMTILNDVLDFSKIEAGKLELEPVAMAPRMLVNSLVALFAPTAASKGLALQVQVDADVPSWLMADPGRLRQVLANLLGNAVKFTSTGAVTVAVRAQVRQDAAAPDGAQRAETGPAGDHPGTPLELTCSVTDTGIGMPPEVQARLFEAFTQADASTTRRFGGTGLGLVISRRLVECMGGRLVVSSAPGAGSTFSFSIPCTVAAVGHELSAQPDAGDARRFKGRVLLVEDNPVNRKVARINLERLGIVVLQAENGSDALRIVGSEPCDLVLMDMHMPVMDGIEATRCIRAAEADGSLPGRVPIVAMTANVMGEATTACHQAGMDDFLPKPYTRDQLLVVLQRWLTADEAAAEPVLPGGAPSSASNPGAMAAQTARADAKPAGAAIDERIYEQLCRNMGEDIGGLIEEFSADAEQLLGVAQHTSDAAAVARVMHTLKSSAATMGALRLSGMARTLEAQAKGGDLVEAELAQARAAMRQELSDVLDALGQRMASVESA